MKMYRSNKVSENDKNKTPLCNMGSYFARSLDLKQKNSGLTINPILDGLTKNTRRHFAHCWRFLRVSYVKRPYTDGVF